MSVEIFKSTNSEWFFFSLWSRVSVLVTVAGMKHNGQGNLQKQEFIWAHDSRGIIHNSRDSMEEDRQHGG